MYIAMVEFSLNLYIELSVVYAYTLYVVEITRRKIDFNFSKHFMSA